MVANIEVKHLRVLQELWQNNGGIFNLLNWQAKDNVKLELDLVNKEIRVKES